MQKKKGGFKRNPWPWFILGSLLAPRCGCPIAYHIWQLNRQPASCPPLASKQMSYWVAPCFCICCRPGLRVIWSWENYACKWAPFSSLCPFFFCNSMNHHHHARFTVYSPPPPPPPPPRQHAIPTMQLHAFNYIPPPHHSHYHSAPPQVHPHYYMPTQWQQSTYAAKRSSLLSSPPTHRKRKKCRYSYIYTLLLNLNMVHSAQHKSSAWKSIATRALFSGQKLQSNSELV